MAALASADGGGGRETIRQEASGRVRFDYIYSKPNNLLKRYTPSFCMDSMDAEELDYKITEILGLEEEIKNRAEKKIEFGDFQVVTYNCFLKSLPDIFSLDDMIDYHTHLHNKILNGVSNNPPEEQSGSIIDALTDRDKLTTAKTIEKFLKVVREACTPSAYSIIESAVRTNINAK